MFTLKTPPLRTRLLAWFLLSVLGLAVVAFMSVTVAKDLRLLNSASSDNVQWTLSQAEVEFLEYELHLARAIQDPAPHLRDLRREFDIFYSRVATLRESSIYETLRRQEDFSTNLDKIHAFLLGTVPAIDGSDADLIEGLPHLFEQARDIRSTVRRLSISGLTHFAAESDQRRTKIAVTLMQMAAVVSILLLALLLLALYLNRLNIQNIRRRSQVVEANKRMKIVTGTALDAVVVSDATGRVLDFNAAAEQIFGYTTEEAIGRDLADLIVPDHFRAAHEAGLKRMRESGEKRVVGKGRVKLEAKRADGQLFPVELAIQSAQTDDGERFIAFLRDISHLVKAEAELVAARDRALAGEKAKTDFLATMSHEIRTPLNGLLGNLSLLRETRLSPKQARYIKNMDTSGKLLMGHISDVLDITKYDAGKLRLRPVEMNISTLLQDIIDNQSGAASANDTTLQWGWVDAPLTWIRADRDRIQHILMNLIGNAVKFTHGGSVRVTAQVDRDAPEGPQLLVTVRDTGIGIDADQIDRIFDDFMTGDSSYDRDVGGTGLGLGIAKRFVTALGGTIEVDSEKGTGSTFRIRLPVEPIAAPAQAAGHETGGEAGRPKHVLLVEDNEINRVLAREMLTAAGHRVTEAPNGRVAVDLAEQQHFDVILMDISMPVLDGRGATREIRAGTGPSAQSPIIAVTANAMAEEKQAFLSDGMTDILTKPLTREGLLKAVSDQAAPAPAETEAVADLVDRATLDEMRDTLGAEAQTALLGRFVTEVDRTLSELSDADPQDLTETAAQAHKTAGSAGVMGAAKLRAALVAVENAAKRADHAGTKTAIKALPAIWAATLPILQVQGDRDDS
ncbi:ATP-binding protein [Aquicoccus sp. SU-CL01552]|uniref:hybrid sensor histidine kinase/response regulator n=1 Tax=Aquicoccus sp. SU-CL01552 TaxID=3127656 RepID=UPI003106AEDA